jgi:integrase
MASLQHRNGSFRFIFRHRGKQHFVTIGKVSREEAEAKAAQVQYLLMRLKQRLIDLPAGVDIVDFVNNDGKSPIPPDGNTIVAKSVTLEAFRDRYIQTHREALEERTINTAELHFKHLVRILGADFPIRDLTLADLQRYVDRRSKEKNAAGKRISPTTTRKDVVTLRTAWNWGTKMGLVAGRYPNGGLCYPKLDEKPPFQTRDQIERKIVAGGLTKEQVKELWHSLYLQVHEIAELLAIVKDAAAYPWIYPLVCMAAHTGARRGELIKMQVTDIDFGEDTVTIREKKRVKGKRSTRQAPLTPLLKEALLAWLSIHPGGRALFCHGEEVARSKKRSRSTGHQNGRLRPASLRGRLETVKLRTKPQLGQLTASEMHYHLKRTIRESKWSVVNGAHVLRHSMISCMAAAGIDQRIIDDIVGHCSEEMRRRYRHLTPEVKSRSVAAVFG